MRMILYAGNTQTVTLPGVFDAVYEVDITGATITATLYDSEDNIVSGFDHLPMIDDAITDGTYVLTLPSTFNPPIGKGYYVVYEGRVGGIGEFKRRQEVEVREAVL